MKIGIVPASTIAQAHGRLDPEFYLGDPLARPIALTEKRVRESRRRLARLKREQRELNAERERLGIVVAPTPDPEEV
jgi:hypothetical protein